MTDPERPKTGDPARRSRPLIRTHTFWRVVTYLLFLFVLIWMPAVDDLERWSFDQRFQWRGTRPVDDSVVIVSLDAESLAWAGDRPFTLWNPLFAELLQAMHGASASTVLLDLLFPVSLDTPIRNRVVEVLASNGIPLPPPIVRQIGFDYPLIKTLLQVQNGGLKVILGCVGQTTSAFAKTSPILSTVRAERFGTFNLTLDPDQVVRSVELYSRDRRTGNIFPSVDLALIAALQNATASVASDGRLLIGDKPVGGLVGGREAYIDFAGPMGTFKREPFHRVLEDARKAPERLSRFAGKTVLVGLWAIEDNKRVPWRGFMSGIEIHANILENLRHNRFLRRPPRWFEWSLVLVFAAAQFLFFGQSLRQGLLATIVLGLAWTGSAGLGFLYGHVFPLARPLLVLFCSGIIESMRLYISLESDRRRIRGLFQRYVNDTVIDLLVKTPHEEIMQGARRQVCVLFSDIRGFTTFSENRSPHEVVTFLNLYFSGLTEIVLRHNGVVDKFLGDGMMAFFNAPLDLPGFETAAVKAALEIRAFTESEAIRSAAAPFDLKTGVALHIGEAVVGNLGSERKMEFTAIGDTVNTTSRLESLNKQFGTDIIVSEPVMVSTRDGFVWRELGEHPIRGKERTIRLFALVEAKMVVQQPPAVG